MNYVERLTDLAGLPLPSLGIPGSGFVLVPTPAVKGGRSDNRDQFFDGLPESLAQRQEPLTLAGLGAHFLGKPCPQDHVLFLQEFDIPGQLAVDGRGDQGEERMENLHGGGMFVNGYRGTSFHIRCTPLDPPKTYSVPVQKW